MDYFFPPHYLFIHKVFWSGMMLLSFLLPWRHKGWWSPAWGDNNHLMKSTDSSQLTQHTNKDLTWHYPNPPTPFNSHLLCCRQSWNNQLKTLQWTLHGTSGIFPSHPSLSARGVERASSVAHLQHTHVAPHLIHSEHINTVFHTPGKITYQIWQGTSTSFTSGKKCNNLQMIYTIKHILDISVAKYAQ